MARRRLLAVAALAATLHAWAIVRTPLPAQDGLKYLRAARDFQHQPADVVIRGLDQHPLYPALIAMAEPPLARWLGPGPDTWRIAAQLVAALAAVAAIVPLYMLGRALHSAGVGVLAALLYVILPLPAEIGHDTLADSLGLLAALATLALGERALRRGSPWWALGSGVAAGVGYWARPEAVIAAASVALVMMLSRPTRWIDSRERLSRDGDPRREGRPIFRQGAVPLMLACLACVGGYALVKGQVSEKLVLRIGAGLPPSARPRAAAPARSSNDSGLARIAPKDEPEAGRMSLAAAGARLVTTWIREIGLLLAPLAIVGTLLAPRAAGHTLLRVYLCIFGILVLRHAAILGYVSHRHVLPLVVAMLPWAAWRLSLLGGRIARRLRWEGRVARVAAGVACVTLAAMGVVAQAKPIHPTRHGHRAAGLWLARNASVNEAVLDTRGWAAFLSGLPAYDTWHVRQALTDGRLAYLVVERSELSSGTERAQALVAFVAERGRLAAAFPQRRGGWSADILVYRVRASAEAAEASP
jgi:hypothetical protein